MYDMNIHICKISKDDLDKYKIGPYTSHPSSYILLHVEEINADVSGTRIQLS